MRKLRSIPGLLIAIVAIIGLGSGGCATSPGFQAGAAATGPVLSTDATQYVQSDTTLDPSTKQARIVQATQLGTDTATAAQISAAAVAADWSAVKPWLLNYWAADPLLKADPDLSTLKYDVAARLDAMITAEQARPFGFQTVTTQPSQ